MIGSEIKVRPNAATAPYIASPVATAPAMIKPGTLPRLIEVRIVIRPTGPTGAAIANPKIAPFMKSASIKPENFLTDRCLVEN